VNGEVLLWIVHVM